MRPEEADSAIAMWALLLAPLVSRALCIFGCRPRATCSLMQWPA